MGLFSLPVRRCASITGRYLSDMQIAIAKEYIGLTDQDHEEALEWCKASIQKRINSDHLEDLADWNDLIVKDEEIGDYKGLGYYCMECRLPLKELF